jgi:beta-lactamase regulating signal transducer with metallopeptidase domain
MNATLVSWGVTYLMHSTLLIAAVWLATRVIRSARVRDALWKLALTGAIVTATLQLTVPFERLLPAAAPQRVTVEVAPQVLASAPAMEAAPDAAVPAISHTRETTPFARLLTLPMLGLALWAAGALLLFARLLYGHNRLLSLLATRREVVLGGDRALLEELCDEAGCRRVVRLTESASIHSPMAMVGWEIVVPRGRFARLTDGQRRTILAHELAHLMRRDPLWLAVAEVVKAVLFFQPLNRFVQARLKETAEFLCDDAAVLQTGDRQALAETLAELAASVAPMPASVAAMAEGGSNLIVRVSRVLRGQGSPDLPLRMRWRLAIGLVPLVVMALFAPGVAPALTQASSARAAAVSFQATATANRATAVAATPAPVPAVLSRVAATTRNNVMGAVTAAVKAVTPAPSTLRLDGTFNRFGRVSVGQKYDGPNGVTHVRLEGKSAEVAQDASWIRFLERDGFIQVVETSERGPKREAEVKAGPDGKSIFRYVVDGDEQPWNAAALTLLASGWLAEDAYEGGKVAASCIVSAASTGTSRPVSSSDGMSTWNAHVELTGETDGVPTHFDLRAVNVRYDRSTGEVDFPRGSSLVVEETRGDRWRQFNAWPGNHVFKGSWDAATDDEMREWLTALLRKNTDLPAKVIRNLM